MRIWLHLLSLLLICPTLFAGDPEFTADLVHRRESVMQKMGNRGMLIFLSADRRPYSGDVAYEFRQENNLFYLTGIRQPDTTLVLMPQNSSSREILFLTDRNTQREIWDGKMLSPQEAVEVSGIQTIRSASEFDSFLDSALQNGVAEIFLLMEPKARIIGEVRKEPQFADRLRERFSGIQIKDASQILAQLRVIKSPYEIKQLREAIDITIEAQVQAMQSLHPGLWEYEVEALIEYVFKKRNSFDWAFPSIIASGPNATTLHYQDSQRQTQDGELLLMDIGAEYNYYAADITRTIPVNGKFTPEQTAIYQLVLTAQEAAIEMVKPGASVKAVHQKAVDVLKEGLLRLGLITDPASHQYRVFTIHGIGHFVGLDVHDVSHGDRLESNMVLTVEPGIYVREDSELRLANQGVTEKELEKIRPALRKFVNIGVRIEEDVLVTENGYQVLSAGAPREIREIEARMGGTLTADR